MIFPTDKILQLCIDEMSSYESELNLKVNSRGNLAKLPAPESLQSWMNAVMFSVRSTSIQPFTQSAREFSYILQAWCCRAMTDGEDFVSDDQTFCETVVSALMSMDVSTVSDTTCRIEKFDKAEIDYDPEESLFYVDYNISVIKVEIPVKAQQLRIRS